MGDREAGKGPPSKGPRVGGSCQARTTQGTPCRWLSVPGYRRCRHHHGRCRALTKSGKPCRGGGLNGTGRCKWHGGLSTGPVTTEGKRRVALNLPRVRDKRHRVGGRKWT
ncbi:MULTISPECIES: HGGxSTG domain-containing protein [Lysobacteraceae]|uniref:HGGxSTG domain-containing protein n=1 Tax=Lysobacteraceae TaxID=32033 RepID=UPI00387E2397